MSREKKPVFDTRPFYTEIKVLLNFMSIAI